MDLLNLINQRQSCRNYLKKPVDRKMVDFCLEAARLAPSACNSQPWHFLVVDTEPLRSELANVACGGLYSLNKFILNAPVLIAVVTERSRYTARLGGHFRGVQYALIDIGIACQHLDLAAAEQGLGSCWLGWFNEKKVKKVLNLPKSTRIDIMFSLGYPAETHIRKKARKDINEIRTFLATKPD